MDEDFVWAIGELRRVGYQQKFGGRVYLYVDVGDFPILGLCRAWRRAEVLVTGLRGNSDQARERARETLRGFIDKIIIPPGDGKLRLVGNLGEMLTAATGWDGTALAAVVSDGCGGPLPSVPHSLYVVAA